MTRYPLPLILQNGTVKKCKASKINAAESTVTLATGEDLPYDFLILVTGILPPKTGEDTQRRIEEKRPGDCFLPSRVFVSCGGQNFQRGAG